MGEDRTGTASSRSASGRILCEPEMRPVFVIVADVFGQEPFQMLSVHGDHMIEQVATATLDPALHVDEREERR
jgi:hypothetical protein